jgi:cytochrome c-type biogenesis protein CcmH
MAWAWVLLFAAAAIILVWRFAHLPKGGLELVLAATVAGLAGYAWQGSPAQPGTPIQSREVSVPPDPQAIATRQLMTDNYSEAARVASFVDTLDRLGLTREAVIAAKTAIRKDPRNAELWVVLGNALVAHGNQSTSPAAEFAFDRAARIAPDHPAPPFFKGLALAQGGRFDDAEKLWTGLLARAPADAPWRSDVQARLSALAMARQMR